MTDQQALISPGNHDGELSVRAMKHTTELESPMVPKARTSALS